MYRGPAGPPTSVRDVNSSVKVIGRVGRRGLILGWALAEADESLAKFSKSRGFSPRSSLPLTTNSSGRSVAWWTRPLADAGCVVVAESDSAWTP
jgi:hypothetical protein